MHCLRFDRGATPQISCNNEEEALYTFGKLHLLFIADNFMQLANKLVDKYTLLNDHKVTIQMK